MTSHFSPPGKYVPLVQYLEALPADQQTVTLTFNELETLVGPLAATASSEGGYWTHGKVARVNWHRAGFTALFDRRARCAIAYAR